MPLTSVGERGFLLLRRARFTDSFTAARGGILSSMVIWYIARSSAIRTAGSNFSGFTLENFDSQNSSSSRF